MTCWLLILGFMVGAAVLGFLLAWFLKPVELASGRPQEVAIEGAGPDGKIGKIPLDKKTFEKKQKEIDKVKDRYDDLYESKLDVDTALVAAESTLEGLKLDYEKLERDFSQNNKRFKDLQGDFDNYKSKKENEFQKLKAKTKNARENYEKVKFQLAKSNRINEKLQESINNLKEENQKLSSELKETTEEVDFVKASMADLQNDYDHLVGKTDNYTEELKKWESKYSQLNESLQVKKEESKSLKEENQKLKTTVAEKDEKMNVTVDNLQQKLKQAASNAEKYAQAYSQVESNNKVISQELAATKEKANKELEQIMSKFKGLKDDYNVLQEREDLLDDRFVRLSEKHNDLESAYETALDEKESLEDAYNEYKESSIEKFNKLEKDAKEWVKKYESSNKELSQFKDKASELEQNKEQLLAELDKMRSQYDQEMSLSSGEFEALSDNFESLKSKYLDVNKELMTTQVEKDRINMTLESFKSQLKDELEFVKEENEKLSKKINKLKSERRKLATKNEELEEKLEENEFGGGGTSPNVIRKLNKVISKLQKSIDTQEEIISHLNTEKQTLQTTIELLKSKWTKEELMEAMKEKAQKVADNSNLSAIEGITTETELILNEFGIYNFEQLAQVTPKHLELLKQVIPDRQKNVSEWISKAKQLIES